MYLISCTIKLIPMFCFFVSWEIFWMCYFSHLCFTNSWICYIYFLLELIWMKIVLILHSKNLKLWDVKKGIRRKTLTLNYVLSRSRSPKLVSSFRWSIHRRRHWFPLFLRLPCRHLCKLINMFLFIRFGDCCGSLVYLFWFGFRFCPLSFLLCYAYCFNFHQVWKFSSCFFA